MSEGDVDIARAAFAHFEAAVARGEFAFPAAVDEGLVDPDWEWLPARELSMETTRGMDGFAEFMRNWTEDFESWTITSEGFENVGPGRVLGVAVQRGRGKGSGVPVELRFWFLYELKDGGVTRLSAYLDADAAMKAARSGG